MSETRMWCSVEVAGNVYKMLVDYLNSTHIEWSASQCYNLVHVSVLVNTSERERIDNTLDDIYKTLETAPKLAYYK